MGLTRLHKLTTDHAPLMPKTVPHQTARIGLFCYYLRLSVITTRLQTEQEYQGMAAHCYLALLLRFC